MAAKRGRKSTKAKQGLPIGPMLISFAVGAFVMFLIYLNDNVEPQSAHIETAKVEQKTADNKIEPTFDFYDILPEMEVEIEKQAPVKKRDIVEKKPVKEKTKTASIEPTKSKGVSYLIQVGSFKSPVDADSFKAKVALLGIESKVQTVTIDNKETWHRVLIGPIVGLKKAEGLKDRLKKNNINGFLLRTRRS